MKPARLIAVLAALIALSLFAVACGDDDEGSGSGSETSQESGPAKVTLTAQDTPDYSFKLSATPTADTKSVTFKNEGTQQHVMIFARINEGFTLDEAFQMEGKGGSATVVAEGDAKPGQTRTLQIDKPLKPGHYAMLCPIGGPKGPHYKLGQLQEFDIQ